MTRGGPGSEKPVAAAILAALLVSFAPVANADGASSAPALAISDVTLIDGNGGPSRPHVSVTVENGRITRIGSTVPSRPGGRSVNGTGKFLIPGLWDMHVHLTNAGDVVCPVLLANGVTGVRDMGGDMEVVDWMRTRIEQGVLPGPRIFRPGPYVDGSKPGVADRLVIDTREDGRRAVGYLRQRSVDFIKVHNGAPPDAYFALLEEARRARILVAGHIPLGVDPDEAIEAGHGSVEHVVSLFEGPVSQKVKAGKTQQEAFAEFTDVAVSSLARRMAARHTWFDPTLITYWTRSYQWDLRAKPDPRKAYVSASLESSWATVKPLPDKPEVRTMLARAFDRFVEIASIARRENVRFLVGTDLGAPYVYPGFSVHEELEWLVKAGFTPAEVLSIATRNSAESLGRLADLGTIEEGKRADLVLLDADPLESISSTRRIAAVVADGRLYPKADLDALLAKAAAEAASR